jgi:hypothetical protein
MHKLFETTSLLTLQRELIQQGIPVYWYDDVPTTHANFVAIQFLAASRIMRGEPDNLSFKPDQAINRGDAALALTKILPGARKATGTAQDAVDWCVENSYLSAVADGTADLEAILSSADREALGHQFQTNRLTGPGELSRAEFAQLIYQAAERHLEAARI